MSQTVQYISVFRPEGLSFHTGIFLTMVNFTGINSRYTGGARLLTYSSSSDKMQTLHSLKSSSCFASNSMFTSRCRIQCKTSNGNLIPKFRSEVFKPQLHSRPWSSRIHDATKKSCVAWWDWRKSGHEQIQGTYPTVGPRKKAKNKLRKRFQQHRDSTQETEAVMIYPEAVVVVISIYLRLTKSLVAHLLDS